MAADYPEKSLNFRSEARGGAARLRARLSLRAQVMVLLAVTVLISAGVMQYWIYRVSLRTELVRVEEKHLIMAEHLAASIERYIDDSFAELHHISRSMTLLSHHDDDGHAKESVMHRFDILGVIQLAADGSLIRHHEVGDSAYVRAFMSSDLPSIVTQRAAKNRPSVSGIQMITSQDQAFLLYYEQDDGTYLVGLLRPGYIRSLQRAISFGKKGHAAIFDQTGKVIAHPVPRFEEEAVDLSAVPVVANILQGQTGVGTFQSVAKNVEMIAGYTQVPSTGWGVMVPQPTAEIKEVVAANIRMSGGVALACTLVCLGLGWWAARVITAPVNRITRFADAVAQADGRGVDPLGAMPSTEFGQLAESLEVMRCRVREARENLRVALRAAEDANRAKGNFLSILGHELKNPLNGVIGNIDLALETTLSPEARTAIEAADVAASSLNRLTNDILHFTRTGKIGASVEFEPLPVTRFLGILMAQHDAAARTKGVALDLMTEIPADTVLMLDRLRTSQIVNNLLSNAVKFTDAGRVTLSARILSNADTGMRLILIVEDTGVGISSGRLNRIFDTLHGLDVMAEDEGSGLGIGLSAVRGAVEMLDGEITCDSAIAHGSRFRVSLPVTLAVAGNDADDSAADPTLAVRYAQR